MKTNKFKIIVAMLLCVVMISTFNVTSFAAADDIIIQEKLVFGKSYKIDNLSQGQSAKYKFSLTQSGQVSVVISSKCIKDGSWEPYIKIFESNGTQVAQYKLDNNSTRTCTWDILAGDYYLLICANNNFKNTWKLSFVADFENSGETYPENWIEKNDEVTMATPYTAGKSVNGFLAMNEYNDVYKMILSKPGYLSFKLVSKMPKVNFEIFDAKGKFQNEYYDIESGTHIYKEFVPAGTYYINIKENYYYTGCYSFTASLAPITKTNVTSAKAKYKKSGSKIKRSLLIKWAKKSGVSGYQIQVSNKAKFSSKKTYDVTGNSLNVTNYKFAKGKKYYVRVRTYIKDDSGAKFYSDWSNVKSVKFKK